MTTDRDMTRVVRSWLRTDEHESAGRVLDNVLAALDATPQRPAWWPAWRIAPMNTYAKLAIAAAAVLVVAVVGYNFLPGIGGSGGPSATPAPCVPNATPSGSPGADFPPSGELPVGTCQSMTLDGGLLAFRVASAGWSSDGTVSIFKGPYAQTDSSQIDFWPSAPDNVYADPCAHTPLNPPPDGSAADLAAAVATIPGTDLTSAPSSVNVGGHPAVRLVLTIREDLGCDPHTAYLWYDESTGGATTGWRWAEALGARLSVWIIDVDGTLVWINSYTFKGSGPEPSQAIQQIIDSIQFE